MVLGTLETLIENVPIGIENSIQDYTEYIKKRTERFIDRCVSESDIKITDRRKILQYLSERNIRIEEKLDMLSYYLENFNASSEEDYRAIKQIRNRLREKSEAKNTYLYKVLKGRKETYVKGQSRADIVRKKLNCLTSLLEDRMKNYLIEVDAKRILEIEQQEEERKRRAEQLSKQEKAKEQLILKQQRQQLRQEQLETYHEKTLQIRQQLKQEQRAVEQFKQDNNFSFYYNGTKVRKLNKLNAKTSFFGSIKSKILNFYYTKLNPHPFIFEGSENDIYNFLSAFIPNYKSFDIKSIAIKKDGRYTIKVAPHKANSYELADITQYSSFWTKIIPQKQPLTPAYSY